MNKTLPLGCFKAAMMVNSEKPIINSMMLALLYRIALYFRGAKFEVARI